MVNLGHIIKSRHITLPTKVRILKAMIFPVVMYGCESWTIRKAEGQGKEVLRIEQVVPNFKKAMNCLGRLAFYSLIKKKTIFHEQDMKIYGVDLSSLNISLSNRLLLKEETPLSTIYCFPHLTFQEFLAATYYYSTAKRALFDLFVESEMSWPKLGFLNHFKNAVQRSLQSEDGYLDVFIRFLAGLLSPQVNKALADWFLVRDEHHNYRSQVVSLLQNLLDMDQVVSWRTINLMQCLHEIQHMEVAMAVEEAMKTENLAGRLTPVNCSALVYLLQTSEVCEEEAKLSNCLTIHALQKLLSQLLYCNHLRLDSNQFKDGAMDLLSSILSRKDCQIQKISLAENEIGNKGAKAIARSLMANRSLMSLDLRNNYVGSKGAKAFADALKINQYLLSLNLQNNMIKEGTKWLAEALSHNHTLMTLQLQKNSVGPQGSKKIAEALKKNSVLKELILSSNSVGDTGAAALAEGLKVNQCLLTLDFQSNSISDIGVTALTQALCSNQVLTGLNLRENSISKEGAWEIANALRVNSTLRNLELTANLLHDEGIQAIALALKKNQALSSLHLQWNFVQMKAAKALSQALQVNKSITVLDLQENAIGDEGAVALVLDWGREAALRVPEETGRVTTRGLKHPIDPFHNRLSLRIVRNAKGALNIPGGPEGGQLPGAISRGVIGLHVPSLQVAQIGERGAKALGDALLFNKSLVVLDLRGNTVGLAGAKALASALKVNRTLCRLNLQENSLGMDGAICIATALTGCHNLTYINLQGNQIGDSGAKVIADAICTNAPNCVVKI